MERSKHILHFSPMCHILEEPCWFSVLSFVIVKWIDLWGKSTGKNGFNCLTSNWLLSSCRFSLKPAMVALLDHHPATGVAVNSCAQFPSRSCGAGNMHFLIGIWIGIHCFVACLMANRALWINWWTFTEVDFVHWLRFTKSCFCVVLFLDGSINGGLCVSHSHAFNQYRFLPVYLRGDGL